MSIEMIITTLAMVPAAFVGFTLYVWVLLYVARVFSGFIKDIIAALIYGAFAVLVVTPLYYLISINQPALMEGNNKLLAIVMFSYFVVVAPGFYYLFKKIGVLRNAGYFKPRS
jgi:hypothetical protein